MTTLRTITVRIGQSEEDIELQVEEWVPIDLSCYQYEAGWSCYQEGTEREYFVSESGEVWIQPQNEVVGISPKVAEQYEQWTRSFDV